MRNRARSSFRTSSSISSSETEPLSALHVTNGDSVAGTLRATSLGGDVLPWRDAYHEGPVLAGSRDRMLRHRADFLAACGWGDADSIHDSLLARDDEFVDALREGRHVVLWFEHDLYDQLQLLDALALAGDMGFEDGALELIESGTHLGPLDARSLEALWESRREAQEEDTASAQLCWSAVRAAQPTELAQVLGDPPPSRPYLAAAIRRFLQELPWVGDGLSRTERQLLSLLVDGPMLSGALFLASQELEEAAFHGDTWISRTLEQLAPLVAVGEGFAELTREGRAVLAGTGDRVSYGLDRWLGGTHLRPGAVWRWDDSSGSLRHPG